MNNCSTSPSALIFLTSIPAKIPWAVLQESGSICEDHPYSKAVPVDLGIGSLGTYLMNVKIEALIVKEEWGTKANDAGV